MDLLKLQNLIKFARKLSQNEVIEFLKFAWFGHSLSLNIKHWEVDASLSQRLADEVDVRDVEVVDVVLRFNLTDDGHVHDGLHVVASR